jgi:hypothetical protein
MRKIGDGMHSAPHPEEAPFETPQGRLLRINYGRLEGRWLPIHFRRLRRLRQFGYGLSNIRQVVGSGFDTIPRRFDNFDG